MKREGLIDKIKEGERGGLGENGRLIEFIRNDR